jgi:hypothetical protein
MLGFWEVLGGDARLIDLSISIRISQLEQNEMMDVVTKIKLLANNKPNRTLV